MAPFLAVAGDDRDRSPIGQLSAEIPLFTIHHGGNGSLGKARTDRLGHGGRGGTLGKRALRTVRQCDRDIGHSAQVYECISGARPPLLVRRSAAPRPHQIADGH